MQEQKKQKLKADGYLNSVEPLVIKLIEFLTNNDEYEIGCDLGPGLRLPGSKCPGGKFKE